MRRSKFNSSYAFTDIVAAFTGAAHGEPCVEHNKSGVAERGEDPTGKRNQKAKKAKTKAAGKTIEDASLCADKATLAIWQHTIQ